MWRTRVGYAGGDAPDPTYRRIGDHTECFQVDFDAAVVSYDDLLELFWTSHDATRPAFKEQYASLVLAHDAEQLAQASDSQARIGAILGRMPVTRIEPLKRFYPAEDYHQKYYLRNDRVLMREFSAIFGDDEVALRESTAAARANGFAGGFGSRLLYEAVADGLGLSEDGRSELARSAHLR